MGKKLYYYRSFYEGIKMAEETKYNSTDAGRHFDYITSVMEENETFLDENAGETYDEVLELILGSIEYVSRAVKRERSKEEYVKHPTIFFLHHILMASSYAIQSDLLTGNLPCVLCSLD